MNDINTRSSTGFEFQSACSKNSVQSNSIVSLQGARAELHQGTVSTCVSPSSRNSSSNFEEFIAALKTPPTTPPPMVLKKIEQQSIADNVMEKLIIMDDVNKVIESIPVETVVEADSQTMPIGVSKNAEDGNSEAESLGESIEKTDSIAEEFLDRESIVHCMK